MNPVPGQVWWDVHCWLEQEDAGSTAIWPYEHDGERAVLRVERGAEVRFEVSPYQGDADVFTVW